MRYGIMEGDHADEVDPSEVRQSLEEQIADLLLYAAQIVDEHVQVQEAIGNDDELIEQMVNAQVDAVVLSEVQEQAGDQMHLNLDASSLRSIEAIYLQLLENRLSPNRRTVQEQRSGPEETSTLTPSESRIRQLIEQVFHMEEALAEAVKEILKHLQIGDRDFIILDQEGTEPGSSVIIKIIEDPFHGLQDSSKMSTEALTRVIDEARPRAIEVARITTEFTGQSYKVFARVGPAPVETVEAVIQEADSSCYVFEDGRMEPVAETTIRQVGDDVYAKIKPVETQPIHELDDEQIRSIEAIVQAFEATRIQPQVEDKDHKIVEVQDSGPAETLTVEQVIESLYRVDEPEEDVDQAKEKDEEDSTDDDIMTKIMEFTMGPTITKALDQIKAEVDARVSSGESVPEASTSVLSEPVIFSQPKTALNYLDIVRRMSFQQITMQDYLEHSLAEPIQDTYEDIQEYFEDIFNSDSTWALAHCVSSDLAMFRGVAVQFRQRYNQINFLRQQYVRVGYVAVLNHFSADDLDKNGRFIFYLVTKDVFNHRPTYYSIYCCLVRLRAICEALNVTKLAMPRIASGCDRMDFRKVRHLIHMVFLGSQIQIRIYTKLE